jgi:hypothetical protein
LVLDCPCCGGSLSRWRLMRAPTPSRIYCPSCGARLRISGRRWPLGLCTALCSATALVLLALPLGYLHITKGVHIALCIAALIVLDGACWFFYEYCLSIYVSRHRLLEPVLQVQGQPPAAAVGEDAAAEP